MQACPKLKPALHHLLPPYNSRHTANTSEGITPMEAERINAIANRISDLTTRAQELRRYL